MVIQQEFQQCGIGAGSKEIIGGYQKTVGRLMKKVTEDGNERGRAGCSGVEQGPTTTGGTGYVCTHF